MAQSIHISIARKMLQKGTPIDIKAWKKNGEILSMEGAIPLRYDFYSGTWNIKSSTSHAIRKIRAVCIFEVNGLEVYL